MQTQSDWNKGVAGGGCPSASAASAPLVGVSGLSVDVDAVKETISKALAQRSTFPRYEELATLHVDLLKYIQALMPLTQRRIERLWHGSPEWYTKRSTLSYIPYEVGRGLGSGLQSAALHVKSLGYMLRFLLENSGLLGAEESVKS